MIDNALNAQRAMRCLLMADAVEKLFGALAAQA
jgi:hypothetical protein